MSATQLFLISNLVLLSMFFSSAEVALFSLSKAQWRNLKDRFNSIHTIAKKLVSDPSGVLLTILVCNELLNVAISTYLAHIVDQNPQIWQNISQIIMVEPWLMRVILSLMIISPVLLFICEITPKVLGVKSNLLISTLTLKYLMWVYKIFWPVRFLLQKIIDSLAKITGVKIIKVDPKSKEQLLKEQEFLHLVEEGHKEGTIDQTERDMIKKVLELDDTRAIELCTPIESAFTLANETSLRTAIATLKSQNRYSRIPVYATNKSNVVGIVYSKDLLVAALDASLLDLPLSHFYRKPLRISPQNTLSQVFRKMRLHKVHIVVIEDSPGHAIGILTLTNVLELLTEEISEVDFST